MCRLLVSCNYLAAGRIKFTHWTSGLIKQGDLGQVALTYITMAGYRVVTVTGCGTTEKANFTGPEPTVCAKGLGQARRDMWGSCGHVNTLEGN